MDPYKLPSSVTWAAIVILVPEIESATA